MAHPVALAAAGNLGFDECNVLILTCELRENNGAYSALRYPETDEAHLVAFGVAGIGAIEIRSVKGAWAGIAFVGAAMRQGCGMSRIHRRLAFAQKTRHDSVAGKIGRAHV